MVFGDLLEERAKREIEAIEVMMAVMAVMAVMAYKDFPGQLDQKVNQEVPH